MVGGQHLWWITGGFMMGLGAAGPWPVSRFVTLAGALVVAAAWYGDRRRGRDPDHGLLSAAVAAGVAMAVTLLAGLAGAV